MSENINKPNIDNLVHLNEHELCQHIKNNIPETRNLVREMTSFLMWLKELNQVVNMINSRISKKIRIRIEIEE